MHGRFVPEMSLRQGKQFQQEDVKKIELSGFGSESARAKKLVQWPGSSRAVGEIPKVLLLSSLLLPARPGHSSPIQFSLRSLRARRRCPRGRRVVSPRERAQKQASNDLGQRRVALSSHYILPPSYCSIAGGRAVRLRIR